MLLSILIMTQQKHQSVPGKDKEEGKSGITGTGVSQKDLQISEKTKEEEKC